MGQTPKSTCLSSYSRINSIPHFWTKPCYVYYPMQKETEKLQFPSASSLRQDHEHQAHTMVWWVCVCVCCGANKEGSQPACTMICPRARYLQIRVYGCQFFYCIRFQALLSMQNAQVERKGFKWKVLFLSFFDIIERSDPSGAG